MANEIVEFAGYVDKLSSAFTNEEREIFVDNFALFMQYRKDPNAFVIDIEDVVQWLGFSQKVKAVRLLKENFEQDVDFSTAFPTGKAVYKGGGHNKECIMLSVRTFKKLGMIAKTTKADQVREYYLKMEEVLMEHFETCNSKLHQQLACAQLQGEGARSQGIIKGNANVSLAYIFKLILPSDCVVDKESDEEIYKWGVTEGAGSDIGDRVQQMRSRFGVDVIVVEVFRCQKPNPLERKFLQDKRFSKCKFTEPINKSTSTEAFKFSSRQLASFRLAVQKEYTKASYQGMSIEERGIMLKEKELELEHKRLDMLKSGFTVDDMERVRKMSTGTNASNSHASTSTSQVSSDEIQLQPHSDSNGDLVYIYDPADLKTHVNYFDNITEATRAIANTSHSNIKEVARKCTVFRGYRWQLVQRGLSFVPPLPPTVDGQKYRTGFIARISDDGAVLDVLPNPIKMGGEVERESRGHFDKLERKQLLVHRQCPPGILGCA